MGLKSLKLMNAFKLNLDFRFIDIPLIAATHGIRRRQGNLLKQPSHSILTKITLGLRMLRSSQSLITVLTVRIDLISYLLSLYLLAQATSSHQ